MFVSVSVFVVPVLLCVSFRVYDIVWVRVQVRASVRVYVRVIVYFRVGVRFSVIVSSGPSQSLSVLASAVVLWLTFHLVSCQCRC